MSSAPALQWKIDECAVYFDRIRLRGWACHATQEITLVELVYLASSTSPEIGLALQNHRLPSLDVAASLGSRADHSRFDEWLQGPPTVLGGAFILRFTLADGSVVIGEDALTNAAWGDPYFQSWENFITALGALPGGAVLEIGSRARSAITRGHRIPPQLSYVGLDILPGPNVDVVGDAHELASIFPEKKFVAIFSTSVFEHLLMPWKVALEMNHILEPGGIVYTSTHQTWPIHEEPWDFWRFSRTSWQGLFNPATGFEILEAVVGEPARVHACRTSEVTRDMPHSPVYLGSASLVRKVSGTTLHWPVPVSTATASMYPAGELAAPPTLDRT